MKDIDVMRWFAKTAKRIRAYRRENTTDAGTMMRFMLDDLAIQHDPEFGLDSKLDFTETTRCFRLRDGKRYTRKQLVRLIGTFFRNPPCYPRLYFVEDYEHVDLNSSIVEKRLRFDEEAVICIKDAAYTHNHQASRCFHSVALHSSAANMPGAECLR